MLLVRLAGSKSNGAERSGWFRPKIKPYVGAMVIWMWSLNDRSYSRAECGLLPLRTTSAKKGLVAVNKNKAWDISYNGGVALLLSWSTVIYFWCRVLWCGEMSCGPALRRRQCGMEWQTKNVNLNFDLVILHCHTGFSLDAELIRVVWSGRDIQMWGWSLNTWYGTLSPCTLMSFCVTLFLVKGFIISQRWLTIEMTHR